MLKVFHSRILWLIENMWKRCDNGGFELIQIFMVLFVEESFDKTYPTGKKSAGVKSGERGELVLLKSSAPPSPIHLSGKLSFGHILTSFYQWGGAPFCVNKSFGAFERLQNSVKMLPFTILKYKFSSTFSLKKNELLTSSIVDETIAFGEFMNFSISQ